MNEEPLSKFEWLQSMKNRRKRSFTFDRTSQRSKKRLLRFLKSELGLRVSLRADQNLRSLSDAKQLRQQQYELILQDDLTKTSDEKMSLAKDIKSLQSWNVELTHQLKGLLESQNAIAAEKGACKRTVKKQSAVNRTTGN